MSDPRLAKSQLNALKEISDHMDTDSASEKIALDFIKEDPKAYIEIAENISSHEIDKENLYVVLGYINGGYQYFCDIAEFHIGESEEASALGYHENQVKHLQSAKTMLSQVINLGEMQASIVAKYEVVRSSEYYDILDEQEKKLSEIESILANIN